MEVISYKCPNCGGDLRFDPKKQLFVCEYCGSEFEESVLSKTDSDHEGSDTAGNYEGARSYSCPSCGAEIITDDTTSATFCYYCHNPVVFKGQLSGTYEPDLVIPFAVDKKEAIDSFLAFVKKKKFVPKAFFCKEQIEKISGIYFPFWMYDCEVDGEWNGSGKRIRVYRLGDTEYTETKIYDIERRADLSFEQLTKNALNSENKRLVEAVSPFDLKGAKEFHYGYLSGFQAQKRDMEKEDVMVEIKDTVRASASEMMRSSVKGYTSVTKSSDHIHIKKENWKYLLVPVWVLTYRGNDGKTYYFAMNGQNKRVKGVLPLHKGKVVKTFIGTFLIVFLSLLAGGFFLW